MIDINVEDNKLRTFILCMQTSRAVLKYAETYLYKKTHLSITKLIVLIVLVHKKGTTKPTDLAKWTQTGRNNMTTLIDRMKREKLISSKRSSSDRRAVHIAITDKGRDVYKKAMITVDEVVEQVMSSISEDDTVLFEKILRTKKSNAYKGLEDIDNHP